MIIDGIYVPRTAASGQILAGLIDSRLAQYQRCAFGDKQCVAFQIIAICQGFDGVCAEDYAENLHDACSCGLFINRDEIFAVPEGPIGRVFPRRADGTFAKGAGGESAETARGRATHVNYRTALGDEYDYEVTLPSGRRPDAVDWQNRVVRELKSDARSSQGEGRRQLAAYKAELEDITGEPWTAVLDTYSR